jgi:hypothetical protein
LRIRWLAESLKRSGENAVFQKGKPLPPEAEKNSTGAKPEVKAKGPIVRKKAKAAA